jgi:hypothetical protein
MKLILIGILAAALLSLLLMRRLGIARISIPLSVYIFCFATVVAIGWFGYEIIFQSPAARPNQTSGSMPGHIPYGDVQQIFTRHCVLCHSGVNAPLQLRLTSYQEVIAGSQNGPVVVPGKPQQSELVRRVKGTVKPRMPLNKPPLSPEKIQAMIQWIETGAPGPE